QAPTLVEAHRITRRYLDDSMPVCLLPHWTSKGGMVFSVIMTESFGDEASAREALHALPPEIADAGRIIETWEGGTVFFSHCTADRREGQS
ncbi:MAG: hypothetical protein JXR85_03055, partial [Deltaproteobacteria bacterium]|nr:hypothetical protein [Deltaproteobacteria bacterium]